MKKEYLTFVLILILFSCNNQMKQSEQKNHKFYSIVRSDDLRMNVVEYIDKNLKDESMHYVITIDHIEKNDTTFLNLSYNINLYSLKSRPPIYYFTVKNNIVVVRSNSVQLEAISSESLDSIMKECFPEQYEKYIKTGMAVPSTLSCEEWILKFKNDSLVGRKIIPFIIEPPPSRSDF